MHRLNLSFRGVVRYSVRRASGASCCPQLRLVEALADNHFPSPCSRDFPSLGHHFSRSRLLARVTRIFISKGQNLSCSSTIRPLMQQLPLYTSHGAWKHEDEPVNPLGARGIPFCPHWVTATLVPCNQGHLVLPV